MNVSCKNKKKIKIRNRKKSCLMPRKRKSGKGVKKRGAGVRKTRAARRAKPRRGRGVWSKVKNAAKTALKVAVPVGLAALAYKNRDRIGYHVGQQYHNARSRWDHVNSPGSVVTTNPNGFVKVTHRPPLPMTKWERG